MTVEQSFDTSLETSTADIAVVPSADQKTTAEPADKTSIAKENIEGIVLKDNANIAAAPAKVTAEEVMLFKILLIDAFTISSFNILDFPYH